MSATIAIAIQKGGSGKTTTAVNTAAYLRDQGKKVLLIDLDPQANLTQSMGIEDAPEQTIYHVFKKLASGKSAPIEEVLLQINGIDFIPASLDLAMAELELVSIYGRETLLKQFLSKHESRYDYVLIDCPPAVGMLTVNACTASKLVLMPLQAEFLPYKGLQSFMHSLELIQKQLNPDLQVLGYLLTKFDARKKMHQQVSQQIKEQYKDKVFNANIRMNIALAQAQEKGKDIFHFAKNSNGARDYLDFGEELLERLSNHHEK